MQTDGTGKASCRNHRFRPGEAAAVSLSKSLEQPYNRTVQYSSHEPHKPLISTLIQVKVKLQIQLQEFPGGPMVRTVLQMQGAWSDLWSGNWDPASHVVQLGKTNSASQSHWPHFTSAQGHPCLGPVSWPAQTQGLAIVTECSSGRPGK